MIDDFYATAADVYRDYVINGVPSSGLHAPTNADQRALFAELAGVIGSPPDPVWKLAGTAFGAMTGLSGVNDGKAMSVRTHWTTQEIKAGDQIKLTLGNWYNTANVGDYFGNGSGNMGPYTANGAFCYPGPNDVAFSYAPVAVPLGANLDVIVTALVDIPRGSKIYEGGFAVPASGCQIPVFGFYYFNVGGPSGNVQQFNNLAGETSNCGTLVTDLTANMASIVGNTSHLGFPFGVLAMSVLAPVTEPVLGVVADSEHQGYKGGTDPFNNLGALAWAMGNSVPVLNMACSGKVVATDVLGGFSGTGYATAMSQRQDLALRCGLTHVGFFEGINDVNGGTSEATIQADLQACFNQWSALGVAVFGGTLMCLTTSTNSWAAPSDQTVTANEANRTGINTWLRTVPAPLTGVIDWESKITAGAGKWTGGYTSDGIHWNWAATGAAVSAVNVAAFTASVPAQVIAYSDPNGLGIKNIDAAITYLVAPPVAGALVASTTHTLAGATQMTQPVSRFTTVANAGDAATLPPWLTKVGLSARVRNDGAHAMAVFPPNSVITVDGGSGGGSVTLSAGRAADFEVIATNVIVSNQLGAVSA